MGKDEQGNDVSVTMIEIPAAETEPTKFEKTAYIRVGTNLKPLVDYKEKEAELWSMFDAKHWDITNYGVLMLAKNFRKFEGLIRRGIRVIRYQDDTRLHGIDEETFNSGYAISFEEVVKYIMTISSHEEILEGNIRKK